MIVVKIELHSAITGEVSEIGRMHIVNDASGDSTRGNYATALMRRGTTATVQRRGVVKGHARLAYSVWVLVAKALAGLGFAVREQRTGEATPDPAARDALGGV